MQIVERSDGLAVAYRETGQKQIERALKALDPDLFLNPDRDPETGLVYWTVAQWMGTGHRPHRVLIWRDPYGNPLPLSMGIVDEVRRRERREDPVKAFQSTLRDNEEHRAKLRETAAGAYDDVEREHRKRVRAAELDSLPPFWKPRRFGAGA